ncbi:hypothetical protein SAMN05216267_1024106 [Actinacidiphila rubida]|uniref:DUF3099 domain-containing protein n=1 Tax=Actinacidiphila rubida TaxID=310780 RepID=A0A1H8P5K2_9ACTN|nr:hypothetical protein SAMN05216267_1024106 [Actinacidiphila rubida]
MMGTCVVLFIMAWAVVRLWSVPAAIAMCLVAMVIPPVAAIVANRRGPEDRWFDEPDGDSGDPESDAWWAELDGKGPKDPKDGKDGKDHPDGRPSPRRRPEQGPP